MREEKERPCNEAIRVVIADDHPVVRHGISMELRAAGIQVLGEARSGREALQMVRALQPDVLLLDICMPEMDGMQVVEALQSGPSPVEKPTILVLTAHEKEAYISTMLSAGVKGYVLKEEALDSIVSAVRAVARKRVWLSPRIMSRMAEALYGHRCTLVDLSPREREVLPLLARGWNNCRIAEELILSEQTVKNHVSSIYRKLTVDSRVGAALRAISLGLVSLEEVEPYLHGDGPAEMDSL